MKNEVTVWDHYFSEIVGWSLHPGYLRDDSKDKLTLANCADIADKMVELRQQRNKVLT